MSKAFCENIRCKYHSNENGCTSTAKIGMNGTCKSFEKGFLHYVFLVWDELANSNFIDFIKINLNPDLRIGIYYVCTMYHLVYSISEWGTCRFLRFHQTEGGSTLNLADIQKLPIDEEKLGELYIDFMNGKLPGSEEKTPRKKGSQPFGWLSPTGEFTGSPFGTHEAVAGNILRKQHFEDECLAWKKEEAGRTSRDFLSYVKGYCLIHNPTGDGGYLVSHVSHLTKKQKEFLYGYFSDIGDQFKAEQYLE